MFQTLYLTLDSINRSTDPAFTPEEFPLAYGAVTLSILGVGFGLVALGHAYEPGGRRAGRGQRSWAAGDEDPHMADDNITDEQLDHRRASSRSLDADARRWERGMLPDAGRLRKQARAGRPPLSHRFVT